MIKKYLEFVEVLNESYELILESDVVYSDKFRTALKKVSNSSELAKKLIEIENKDLPVRSNFFDILSDTNDKLSFIPDSKAQEILKDIEDKVKYVGPYGWLKHSNANNKIFNDLGYTYQEGNSPYSPSSDDIGKVMNRAISTKGYTYVWVKWENESGEELGEGVYNNNKLIPYDERIKQVWSKSRQDLKIGRALRALLKSADISFLDKELEELVNQLKAEIGIMNDKFSFFDVVKGDDITYWYNFNKYYKQSGTLGSSCMKHGDSYYFDIYASNPDVCQLVILKSEKDTDKIVGRALLWKLTDGNYFMDRIYTIKDSDVNLFREFCKNNGWYYKYYNNSSELVKAVGPDGEINDSLSGNINIKKGYYNGYPYMDTFKWFSPGSGKLSIHSGDYELENTDGTLGEECEYCGGSGEYECPECYGSGEVECSDCSGSGREECSECEGSGEYEDSEGNKKKCEECEGSGEMDCIECGGSGEHNCLECNGLGEVTCYNC